LAGQSANLTNYTSLVLQPVFNMLIVPTYFFRASSCSG